MAIEDMLVDKQDHAALFAHFNRIGPLLVSVRTWESAV
jgi:hypothetical protein